MIRGSITRLGDKLSELETKERLPTKEQLTTKRMQQRLGEVDEDFRRLYFTIVDLLEQQEDLELERATFNEHKDKIGELGDHLQQLILQDWSAKGINSPTKFGSSCRTLPAFTSNTATFRKQSEVSQSNCQTFDLRTRPRCLPHTVLTRTGQVPQSRALRCRSRHSFNGA